MNGNGEGIVLGHAFAFFVHHTEEVLRIRISLLGKRLKKAKGFLVILREVSGTGFASIPHNKV